MILEIPDFYVGLLSGIIITIAFFLIIGWFMVREDESVDPYHPLNKKEE